MTFRPTATTYLQGSKTLAREIYTHEAVLAEERDRIFSRSWNCVGRTSSISNPGDYIVRTIAGDSIIILRDRNGEVRAFFNTCRHRGTQLCTEASGRFSETI